MRNIHFLLFISVAIFAACTGSTPNTEPQQLSAQVETTTSPFTDTLKLDTFKVELQGEKSKTAKLIFKIISFEGKEVYQTSISADSLIKENVKLKTEKDKMNFLKNEVKYFFEEEHFLWPAVMPDEQPDKNVSDKAFYQELKDTQLNGFNYRTGIESKVYIAWSVKEQKVKVYYEL
jgi:hypothetical protein